MTEQSDADRTPDADTDAEQFPDESAEAAAEAELEAYDLDGDGRVSLTEDVRAELGMLDARACEARVGTAIGPSRNASRADWVNTTMSLTSTS